MERKNIRSTFRQDRALEDTEALAGTAPSNPISRARRAVRIGSLEAVLLGPSSSHAVGDPPTQAEHNALVDDVHRLFAILGAVARG